MKRFLTGILILVLAMGLLAGCNAADGGATEPMENEAHGEDGQKAETPDKEAAEETFVVSTGFPYVGKVYEYCLFHSGKLYTATTMLEKLPENVSLIGKIRAMDNEALPDEELESSQLYVGMKVYALEDGNTLLVEYDSTHVLKMEPYEGDTELLFTPWWLRESTEGSTEGSEADIARKPYGELPKERLFTIALYPDIDRDFVIQRVLDKYNVVLVLDGLSLKSFTVYTKDLLSDDEAAEFMAELSQESRVMSVQRPMAAQDPEDNRISYYKYGPEMMPAGGWDPNDPESAGKENPWTEHATLSAAEKTVGFTFEIPENDLQKIYRTMGLEIIEVIFLQDGEEVCRLRKGVGYGDMSGDAGKTFYKTVATNDNGFWTVFKGSGEDVNIAYRSYTDYSYSIAARIELSKEELAEMFIDDKHTNPEEEDHPNTRDLAWYAENYKEGVTVLELPDEVMTRPRLEFPRQGESGISYSSETLIVKLDLTYDKKTVIQSILDRFPVELKYEFRLADDVIAIQTIETLDEEDLAMLAEEIYAMTGVLDIFRDALNQMDAVPGITGLSDI